VNRSVRAFIVAPLWVPAVVAALGASMFPYPGEIHWVVISTAVAAAFGYLGAAVLGVPAFRLLRSHALTGPLAALGMGVVIGEITWALFGLCFGLVLGEGPAGFVDFIRDAIGGDVFGLLIPAVLGALVGGTYWAMDRPLAEPRVRRHPDPIGDQFGAARN
jgi:hypothetical protein